jgi:hypothetical protein
LVQAQIRREEFSDKYLARALHLIAGTDEKYSRVREIAADQPLHDEFCHQYNEARPSAAVAAAQQRRE